jgi:hypothetical protein
MLRDRAAPSKMDDTARALSLKRRGQGGLKDKCWAKAKRTRERKQWERNGKGSFIYSPWELAPDVEVCIALESGGRV